MGILQILFRSPDWNFAQEMASNSVNEYIHLESAVFKNTDQGRGEPGEEMLYKIGPHHEYVKKLPSVQTRIDALGNLFVRRFAFTKMIVPTPFHLIYKTFVASVAFNYTVRYVQGFNEVTFDINEKTDDERHIVLDALFSRQITSDISCWNNSMHKKLSLIFLSSLVCSFMSITLTSILIAKVLSVALVILTGFRLMQLYFLQEKNSKITNVGHWVIHLWQAHLLDPTLFQRHSSLRKIFYFLQPRIPYQKPRNVDHDQLRTTWSSSFPTSAINNSSEPSA